MRRFAYELSHDEKYTNMDNFPSLKSIQYAPHALFSRFNEDEPTKCLRFYPQITLVLPHSHILMRYCCIERQLREIGGKFISVQFRADGVASICNREYNAFLPRNLSLIQYNLSNHKHLTPC